MNQSERMAVFHRSLERATAEPEFLDRFYQSFMAISPTIQRIFEGTDMAGLKRKLKSSLHVMTLAVEESPGTDEYLRFLGKRHSRLKFNPSLFDLWKGSLLKTVAECDPEFDEDVQAVWAQVIGNGIKRMRDGMVSRNSRTASR